MNKPLYYTQQLKTAAQEGCSRNHYLNDISIANRNLTNF